MQLMKNIDHYMNHLVQLENLHRHCHRLLLHLIVVLMRIKFVLELLVVLVNNRQLVENHFHQQHILMYKQCHRVRYMNKNQLVLKLVLLGFHQFLTHHHVILVQLLFLKIQNFLVLFHYRFHNYSKNI